MARKSSAAKRRGQETREARGEATRPPAWASGERPWGAALVLAVLIAYLPAYFAGFIWDDGMVLTENLAIIGPNGLWEIWTTKAADICPLTLTVFWLEHKLWGLAPFPYHFVNVALHAASAVLLWRVLLRLRIPGAWLGAALWALHPLQVSSVAWIAEMKNTLSGLFFLLATLFFLKALGEANRRRDYALTLLFAALAMASKTSTLILPLELGLCAWWLERRASARTVGLLVPLALMAILPALLSLWTQQPLAENLRWVRSFPERLATAGMAPWFYLGKLVFPYPLMAVYPRWQVDAGDWTSWLPLAGVAAVIFVLWFYRATWARPYFFAFAWFLVALLPVLGLVEGTFWKFSFVADHFQYLAGMGPLALAAALLTEASLRIRLRSIWAPAIPAALLLVLAPLTFQRTFAFQNDGALWSDTLQWNPDCWIANGDLGAFLYKRGEVAAAEAHVRRALQVNPYDSANHQNLGIALKKEGRTEEAMAEFQTALQLTPKGVAALYHLGNAYLRSGKFDAAMQAYQEALQVNPNAVDARNGYGYALLQLGRVDEAITEFEKVLATVPDYTEAHTNLGMALNQKGMIDDAQAQFEQALAEDPNFAEAHNGRGLALARKGLAGPAAEEFQRAIEASHTNPDPEYYNNLGGIFLQQGRLDEAIAQFNEALRLQPGLPDAVRNLADAMRQKNRGHL